MWKHFYNMFYGSSHLTGVVTTNWDTSSAINMSFMFAQSGFTPDVSGFVTDNVTTMSRMFVNNTTITSVDISLMYKKL